VATAPVDPERIRRIVAELAASQASFDSVVAEALLSELDALPPDRQRRYLDMLAWQRWNGRGPHEGGGRHGRPGERSRPPR
jgi:hypothetical protein